MGRNIPHAPLDDVAEVSPTTAALATRALRRYSHDHEVPEDETAELLAMLGLARAPTPRRTTHSVYGQPFTTEERGILDALTRCDTIAGTARELGIDVRALHRRLVVMRAKAGVATSAELRGIA